MAEVLLFKIVVLGGLGFVLVTMMLYTLAVQFKQATDRHDLIYEARRRRKVYLDSILARQADSHDGDNYNVDILDEDGAIEAGEPIGQVGMEPDLRQAA